MAIDVVIGVVETHGRKETAGAGRRLRNHPASASRLQGPHRSRRWISTPSSPGARRSFSSTSSPTPMPKAAVIPKRYLDVQEMLDARHRRLHDAQHPACRKPERRRGADHPHPGARDGSGLHHRHGRRRRDHRPDARRPDQAAAGRQGLPRRTRPSGRSTNYFTAGNLTALRELALRRTAQRVDDQLLNHMQAHAISGPWAAGERVLVSVDQHPRAASLVRYARRAWPRGSALPGRPLYIETNRSDQSDRSAARRASPPPCGWPNSSAAKRSPFPAASIAKNSCAMRRPTMSRTSSSARRAADLAANCFDALASAHDLIRKAGDISVHVISGEDTGRKPTRRGVGTAAAETPLRSSRLSARRRPTSWSRLRFGIVLDQVLDVRNLALVFLMAVLTSAVLHGLRPALYSLRSRARSPSTSSFCRRAITLTISDPESVLALVLLPRRGNHRQQSDGDACSARPSPHRQRARTTEDLYLFSRRSSPAPARSTTCSGRPPSSSPRCSSCAWCCSCRRTARIAVKAGYPPDDTLDDADIAAARWAWEHNHAAGRGADTLPGAKRLYVPLRTGAPPVGVDRPRRRQPRGPAADARAAAPARRAGRPGSARHRTRPTGRRRRPRQACRGSRPPALGAADVASPTI